MHLLQIGKNKLGTCISNSVGEDLFDAPGNQNFVSLPFIYSTRKIIIKINGSTWQLK